MSFAFEVIVIDDGSSNATAQIAEDLGCRVIRQSNQGAAQARKNGLEQVTWAIVCFLDSDDQLMREGVAQALLELSREPIFVGVVGRTQLEVQSARAQFIELWAEGVNAESLLDRGHAPAPPGSFLWRVADIRESYGNDIQGVWPRFAEDYELVIRAALTGEIGAVSTVICNDSPVGGKSTIEPLQSLAASEAIRRHYSRLTRLAIRERSSADLRALASIKRAYSGSASRSPGKRIYYMARAFIASPSYLAYLYFRRRCQKGSIGSWRHELLAMAGFWASPALWHADDSGAASKSVSVIPLLWTARLESLIKKIGSNGNNSLREETNG